MIKYYCVIRYWTSYVLRPNCIRRNDNSFPNKLVSQPLKSPEITNILLLDLTLIRACVFRTWRTQVIRFAVFVRLDGLICGPTSIFHINYKFIQWKVCEERPGKKKTAFILERKAALHHTFTCNKIQRAKLKNAKLCWQFKCCSVTPFEIQLPQVLDETLRILIGSAYPIIKTNRADGENSFGTR